jgi:hypothetical protein
LGAAKDWFLVCTDAGFGTGCLSFITLDKTNFIMKPYVTTVIIIRNHTISFATLFLVSGHATENNFHLQLHPIKNDNHFQ